MRRSVPVVALALAGAAVAAAVRALWLEPRSLRVTRHDLVLPRWPAPLDGLRLAAIADLHAGAPHVDLAKLDRVVAAVNREHPELVALLGDYADPEVALGRRIAPEAVAQRLAHLRAPALAVLGNHDWNHWGEQMLAALRRAGVTVLENDAVPIAVRGARLWAVGLADASTHAPSFEALDAVPDGEPVLVLSHDPDVFAHVPPRVALTLAGHTHGGQVNLPWVRERVTPSRHGARYAQGPVEEDGRHLFVTRGIGTSRLPVRFRAPPEVAALRLRTR
ncbi:MAG TPA: metallophosphoesterase [Solirubrobacteraceae bacterium]|nr:metallophosphoesterase [Solirubrobacteraceae bacterium]